MAHAPERPWLQSFLAREALPAAFAEVVERYYVPFVRTLVEWQGQKGGPLLLGVNGAQGTGKSTLAAWIQAYLRHEAGLSCAILSMDDLYLTRAARAALAGQVHPLLETRGVPGTHDVALGVETIDGLLGGEPVRLPRFDKALDDRSAEWAPVEGPVDMILFEGWCLAALPEPEGQLTQPINALEREEDPDGIWRGYVNAQLAGPYRALFERIDRLAVLKAPDFACVHAWRAEQEAKLRQRVDREGLDGSGLMDASRLRRFMMHYERLTHWMLDEMPERADIVWALRPDHTIGHPKAR
jgi:D-glycerate 3-kinase